MLFLKNYFNIRYTLLVACSAIFLFIGSSNSLCAQNLLRAKEHIKMLCSKDFAGRGYTNEGHIRAANFIEDKFKLYGLDAWPGKSYQQKFKVDVNTFAGKVKLKVNGKTLKPGEDFIMDPSSPSGKARVKVNVIDTTELRSEYGLKKIEDLAKNKRALLFNNLGVQDFKSTIFAIKAAEQPKVLFEQTDDKLTWHISPTLNKTIHFKIKETALPDKINRISYHLENEYKQGVETQNVVAWVKGTSYPDSIFLFTAHYDHLGEMGNDAYVAGANDNASGTALLLNLAEYYAKNPAPYSTVFIAFGGEELGLLGSKHFVGSWWLDLSKIKFQINLDIVGGGSEGIQLVNSRIFKNAYNLMAAINDEKKYLTQLKLRGAAYNSDHAPFFEKEVPCFFIYTLGGPPHYHDVFDRSETLPLTAYENLFKLITEFVERSETVDLSIREKK